MKFYGVFVFLWFSVFLVCFGFWFWRFLGLFWGFLKARSEGFIEGQKSPGFLLFCFLLLFLYSGDVGGCGFGVVFGVFLGVTQVFFLKYVLGVDGGGFLGCFWGWFLGGFWGCWVGCRVGGGRWGWFLVTFWGFWDFGILGFWGFWGFWGVLGSCGGWGILGLATYIVLVAIFENEKIWKSQNL